MGSLSKFGGTTVEVGDELQEFVQRMIRESLPAVLPRMESTMKDIMDAGVIRWPVQDRSVWVHRPGGGDRRGRRARRSGEEHSRNLFRVETVVTAKDVRVRLTNSAPYVFKIKSSQNNLGGKHAWTVLLRTPARDAAKGLAEDLAVDLAELAKKG